MKKLPQLIRWSGMVGVACLLSACEESPAEGHLQIEPASVTITNGTSVVLTVVLDADQQVNLPLVWQVGNEEFGVIAEQRGRTAVYAATGGPGFNIVTVKDQGDNEGVARIDQK